MNARLALLALLLTAALPAQAESGATLVVHLRQVKPGDGPLKLSLYKDPASFRKEDKAFARAEGRAAAASVELRFSDLPPGRYAVMVYHDENRDGVFNRRLGMFPIEGYGLSNNPQVAGPPAFADSAFEVGAGETRISVDMRY